MELLSDYKAHIVNIAGYKELLAALLGVFDLSGHISKN